MEVQSSNDTRTPWRDIFECSPLPNFVISVESFLDDSPTTIIEANEAARALTQSIPWAGAPVPLPSLLDGPSLNRLNEAITYLLGNLSTGQIQIDVSFTSAHSKDASTDHTMHLRRTGTDRLIAQLVSKSHDAEVDVVLEEQRRFRSALLELSELTHTTDDDAEFYHRLLERTVEVVPGAQGGSVQLRIEGTNSFRFVAAVGYDLAGLQLHNLESKEFFRDAYNPEAEIVRDMMRGKSEEISDWLMTYCRVDEIAVNVSAPVVVNGRPVAFLSLDNFEDPDAFNQTSIEMTTVLSARISDLWRRRQLETQLRHEREAFRHEALHDSLTGLSNRRDLEQRLSDMVVNARRYERATALMFVDVDDFKLVNDELGHDRGDRVLRTVAGGLAKVVGAAGVVGRWGGDEFMILPDKAASLSDIEDLSEAVLEYFDQISIDTRRSVQLSIGIAWCADASADPDELRRAADEALYAAKDSGKKTARTQTLSCDAESNLDAA